MKLSDGDLGYVVTGDNFTYPAGLGGANRAFFLIEEGVSLPTGNSGHSAVFDHQGEALTLNGAQVIRTVDQMVGIETAPGIVDKFLPRSTE